MSVKSMTPMASAVQAPYIPKANDWLEGDDGLCTCSIPDFPNRDDDYWLHHVWCKHCIAGMERLNPTSPLTTKTLVKGKGNGCPNT